MTPIMDSPGPEQLRFDTEAVPPGERFARYRELYAGGSDAIETGPGFRAAVRGWRLDRAVLYDRSLHDVGHQRLQPRVEADGFEHFTLTLLVSGELEVDPGFGDGFRALQPGELMLLDMRRTMRNRMHDARVITVSLGRERAEAAARDVGLLHGLVVPSAQAGLLADYLQALPRHVSDLPAVCIPAVTQPIGTLLAVALAAGGDALLLPGHADRVRQLIELRLGDPGFNPGEAVAASGLSRATLYRLFQPLGGLAVYLRRRRLERVRTALLDPTDHRPFGAVAHAAGLTSEGHAARLFRDAYGMPPGEFRAAAARSDAATVGRMEYLVEEVR